MVVGTFTSVSLEPPLVGFLVDRGSTTWPRIRETGRFCASVLHADDEYVCRAFAIKAEGRFDHLTAVPGSGSPRLSRAALWVDCDIDSVMPMRRPRLRPPVGYASWALVRTRDRR